MKQEERWNQFAVTGRVMDYLEYRKSVRDESSNVAAEGKGENERDSSIYRDGINSISNERVR